MKLQLPRVDLRIALIYAIFGGLWITLSDRLLAALVTDISVLSAIQTYKGWAFVLLSTLVISLLLRRELRLRRITEGNLGESEKNYHALFNSMNEGYCVIEVIFDEQNTAVDYRFLEVNPGFEKQTALKDALGKTVRQLDPDPDTHLFKIYGKVVLTGESIRFESPASAIHRIYDVFAFRIGEAGSRRVGVIFNDITERKRAEEELRQSREQISGILASTMDAIITMDEDQNIVIFNNAAEIMFRCSTREALGRSIDLFLPESVRSNHAKYVHAFGHTKATKRTMASSTLELTCVRADGSSFPSDISISKVELDGKNLYTAVIRDITERKQAEERIQRQIDYLKALRTIDISLITSFDLHVILDVVLQQILSYLGIDASAVLLVGSDSSTMEHVASRGFRSRSIQHTQLKINEGHAGRAWAERRTVHARDVTSTRGELISTSHLSGENFVEYYGIPLIVKGDVRGILEIYHRTPLDLSAEQLEFLEALAGQAAIAIDNSQLFQNLQRSNAELERRVIERTAELNRTNLELHHANHTKDEFLATVSHELRTPLNSILGLSETLLEQRRDPLSERCSSRSHRWIAVSPANTKARGWVWRWCKN